MRVFLNGISLAYGDKGTGPAVVLIHGFPLCRRMWRPQEDALAEAGFRVITPDLRGFGDSDAPEGAYSMSLFADDIISLLDHLNIGKAVVGGMSMGGYVLLNMLERFPERIAAACFIVTRGTADDEAARDGRMAFMETIRRFGIGSVTEAFIPYLFSGESAKDPETRGHMTRWMGRADTRGVEGTLHALLERKDYTPLLGQFTKPSLVIGAEEDRTIVGEDLRILTDGLPDSELVVIPGAGHMVNVEKPDAFNECLISFLRRVTPR